MGNITGTIFRNLALEKVQADIDGLGTMSAQDATAVAITGGTATLAEVTTPNLSFAVDINRYGFTDRSATSIAFNDTTFTLTLTGTSWSYYRAGIKYTITGNKTVTLTGTPPATATYFVYIDSTDGTLVASTTVWTFESTKVPVAIILFNDTLTPKFYLSDERHTCLIDKKVHEKWHHTVGTLLKSLGTLAGLTISGTTDAQNTFGVGASYIYDEDILHTLAALTEPDGTTDAYNIFYRTAAAAYSWELSEVPFRYTSAGYIQWDNAGTMTEGAHTKFYNSYLVCAPFGFVMLSGRAEFNSLAAAQAENPQVFDFAGFEVAETVIVRQFTWEARNNLNTKGKCRLAAAPKVISVSVTSALVPAENVGTMATQDANNVSITGGSITGTLVGFTVNTQADDYILVLTDANSKYIRMTKATANNLTVPANADVAFPVGSNIPVRQAGDGQVTIVEGSGVTINVPTGLALKSYGLGSVFALIKIAENVWDLTGDLGAAS